MRAKWSEVVGSLGIEGELVCDMELFWEAMWLQVKWRKRFGSGRSLSFEEVEERSDVIYEMMRYERYPEEYNVVDDYQFFGLNDESRRAENITETILFREGGFEPD